MTLGREVFVAGELETLAQSDAEETKSPRSLFDHQGEDGAERAEGVQFQA